MKRIILTISAALAIGCIGAKAQDVTNVALLEDNYRNSLWFGTYNTASLNFHPISLYSNLGISHDGKYGSWRPQQEAVTSNAVSVETDGAAHVGKFLFWGDFAFRNIFDAKANYNAITYDVPVDMPFFVADNVPSAWNRQEYEMTTRIASPKLWDKVGFGGEFSYKTNVGAKQKDPRVETYTYNLRVLPSVFWQINDHFSAGASGLFESSFQRGEPKTVNTWENSMVCVSRGLGYAQEWRVGGNDGLTTMYYTTKTWGGSLQFGYNGDFKAIIEGGYYFRTVTAKQQPTLPRGMGDTESDIYKGKLQLLFGENETDKVTVEGMFRNSAGLEVVQILNTDLLHQKWETLIYNHMSNFKTTELTATYDHEFGKDEKGYDFDLGATVAYKEEFDEYYVPSTKWYWSNLFGEVFAAKQFKLDKSSWLVKANVGYGANMGGDYVGFTNNGEASLQTLYQYDLTYRTDNYLNAGLRVAYTLNSRKVNYKFDLGANFYNALGDHNYSMAPEGFGSKRLITSFTFGIIF